MNCQSIAREVVGEIRGPLWHRYFLQNVFIAVSKVTRVGIQWRADDLLFDFGTCPNYKKLSKIITDLRQLHKIYNRRVNSARH